MPVLFGRELLDLVLAVDDQLQGDRLHASRAQAAPHLVPQERADLVADEPVEHAARALRRNHLLVDRARMVERLLHRPLRDFVEREAVDFLPLASELLREVPADRFAFTVGVGRDVDVRRLLRRVLQLFDDLLSRRDRLVLFGEVVLDVDPELALRQIADVPHRRDDLEVATQIFVDGLRFRRRLDHHECFCHECSYAPFFSP